MKAWNVCLPVSQFTVRIAHGDIYVRMQIPAGVSFILADRRLRREFPYLVKPCKVSTVDKENARTRTGEYIRRDEDKQIYLHIYAG